MNAMHLGQEVVTTVDAPAAWEGALSTPAGTRGVITGEQDRWGNYGVTLEGDPDQLPASYTAAEITPAK